jgi:hypothetical protein
MNEMKKKGRKTDKEYKKEYKKKLEKLKELSRNFDAVWYGDISKDNSEYTNGLVKLTINFKKNIKKVLES